MLGNFYHCKDSDNTDLYEIPLNLKKFTEERRHNPQNVHKSFEYSK